MKCKDTTWIINENSFKRCDCYEIRDSEIFLENSGISDDTYTFSNFIECSNITKDMKCVSFDYYKNFEKLKDQKQNSLAFLGQSGAGKTHLSIALAINFIKNKYIPVIYISYRNAVIELKQNILDEDFYKKKILKYQSAKLLVIDDLFKGKTTESDKNIIFEIINYRYIKHLPMIISSEYTFNELLNFDEAIGSRIYEMCKDFYIEVPKDHINNYRLKYDLSS